ncbi:hypothetical protein CA3LBN_001556 [Candidozyma haemuli]|uniref:Protein transport protein SEC23 n=1 Tax=Candidozyma haemuli TaxID=45357 RepID=A0ABX8I226_9ASCO|nr:hypothetical protein CA3LBN_001556 [[Candida] haemuloni]
MLWCPFCQKKFPLPEDTQCASSQSKDVPKEESVDYVLPNDISSPIDTRGPAYLYIVDLYQHIECPEEFSALKDRLRESISRLPSLASVGLLTFSKDVILHGEKDVIFSINDFPPDYDFSSIIGDKPAIAKILSKIADSSNTNILKGSKLLQSGFFRTPAEILEKTEHLKPELTRSFKPECASGLALFVASSFLNCARSTSLLGRIKLFSSGPCTIGPGKVVDPTESIRTHDDIANLKAPHFVKAAKFYRALSFVGCGYTFDQANTAAFTTGGSLTNYSVKPTASKFTFDLYFGSLDQVGLYEMCSLSSGTSGIVIFSDSFTRKSFKNKLEAVSDSISSQDCILTVQTSPGLKVSYTLCYGTPYQSSFQSTHLMQYHHERISDTISGFESSMKKRHFTNRWYLGDLRDHVGCVLFETDPSYITRTKAKNVFVQFQLDYWDSKLERRVVRTTTLQKPTTTSIFASGSCREDKLLNKINESARQKALLANFNPETWITILTRLLISKIDTTLGFESFEEVIELMDVTLMKLTKFFGVMKEEASASNNPFEKLKALYSIDENFKTLPIFAYYLRKNPQLVSIFNSSPDETAYFHHIFMGLPAKESCIMIQPRLYEVIEGQRIEKPLETTSVLKAKDGSCFILDTFQTVILYLHNDNNRLKLHSSDNDDIVYERKNEEVNKFIDIINDEILQQRSFVPRITLTQKGHSQARFLIWGEN